MTAHLLFAVAVGKTIRPVIRTQDTPAPRKPIALVAPRGAPTRKLARNAYDTLGSAHNQTRPADIYPTATAKSGSLTRGPVQQTPPLGLDATAASQDYESCATSAIPSSRSC